MFDQGFKPAWPTKIFPRLFSKCKEAPLFSKGYSRYIPWSKRGGDVRGDKHAKKTHVCWYVLHDYRHSKTPRGLHKHHCDIIIKSEIIDINRLAGDSSRVSLTPCPRANVSFPAPVNPAVGRPLGRRNTPRCFRSISGTCVPCVYALSDVTTPSAWHRGKIIPVESSLIKCRCVLFYKMLIHGPILQALYALFCKIHALIQDDLSFSKKNVGTFIENQTFWYVLIGDTAYASHCFGWPCILLKKKKLAMSKGQPCIFLKEKKHDVEGIVHASTCLMWLDISNLKNSITVKGKKSDTFFAIYIIWIDRKCIAHHKKIRADTFCEHHASLHNKSPRRKCTETKVCIQKMHLRQSM